MDPSESEDDDVLYQDDAITVSTSGVKTKSRHYPISAFETVRTQFRPRNDLAAYILFAAGVLSLLGVIVPLAGYVGYTLRGIICLACFGAGLQMMKTLNNSYAVVGRRRNKPFQVYASYDEEKVKQIVKSINVALRRDGGESLIDTTS